MSAAVRCSAANGKKKRTGALKNETKKEDKNKRRGPGAVHATGMVSMPGTGGMGRQKGAWGVVRRRRGGDAGAEAEAAAQRRRQGVTCGAVAPSSAPIMPKGGYCVDTTRTVRRKTRTVWVGPVPIGSEHPIAKQTMTTTDTRDVEASVAQIKKCADAGADIVRLTVQGKREAEAAAEIRRRLFEDGYTVPLVADIHFAPKIAMKVAEAFEKIRVNPGNFADGTKSFEERTYEDESEYQAELAEIEAKFVPLVLKCKELNRAIRIGTNHGSLSARILSYYGDTPAGMVESAFEFARICRKHDFHNFVFSMKASNPLVMAQAYRLLAAEQYKIGWDYPIHLGVTEAGEGEDGRLKSAIGIGSLLLDGIGDTIRVSLTEDPEYEIDPCTRLANFGEDASEKNVGVDAFEETHRDYTTFTRRVGILPEQRDGDALDYRGILHRDGSVISVVSLADLRRPDVMYSDLGCKLAVGMPFKDIATSDSIFMRELPPMDDVDGRRALRRLQEVAVHVIAPIAEIQAKPLPGAIALYTLAEVAAAGGHVVLPEGVERYAVSVDASESDATLAMIADLDPVLIFLQPPADGRVQASRKVFEVFACNNVDVPVIHHVVFDANADDDEVYLKAGSYIGALLVDGLGDGVMVDASASHPLSFVRNTSFGLLQGARMRNTKTEFVSCPSCGRTLFDLQEVTDQIRTKTGHLPGVSIAVMGCIVNGPGEMADADFGYVGGAPGKIDLYVGKEVVRRGIPDEGACDELIELIKEHDRWIEPPSDDDQEAAASEAVVAAS